MESGNIGYTQAIAWLLLTEASINSVLQKEALKNFLQLTIKHLRWSPPYSKVIGSRFVNMIENNVSKNNL